MKKTILSLAIVSSALFASAQIPGINATAAFDDFATVEQYGKLTEDTKWDDATNAPVVGEKAFRGIVWGSKAAEESTPENPTGSNSFVRSGDGVIKYAITQDTGAYDPFVVLPGTYASGSTKAFYTLDLSADANLAFTIKNAGTKDIRASIQVEDINGLKLSYIAESVTDTKVDYYNYQLGYVQGKSAAIPAGVSKDYSYDLKTAIPGSLADNSVILPNNSDFDFSQVKIILITIIDDANTAAASPIKKYNYAPFGITNYPIEISNFKLGDVSTITSLEDNFLTANNNEVVSVYDMMGKFVATGKLKELGLEAGKLYVVKSGNKSRKIVMN